MIAKLLPSLEAQMARVGIGIIVRQIEPTHQLGGATREQRADQRMAVGIVFLTHRLESRSKDVAHRDALAEMHVAERVEVDPAGVAEVFARALGEAFPRKERRTFDEFLRRASPELHLRLTLRELTDHGFRFGFGRSNRDGADRDVELIRRGTSPDFGLAENPVAGFRLGSGIALRNTWGLFRFKLSYLDLEGR